jgi:3-methyladenine DNA glycosylase AlkD
MPQGSAQEARDALLQLRDPEKAQFLTGYFKTGKGQYGEGDVFLGIAVPAVRQIARQFRTMSIADCEALLQSEFNELRLLALLVMVSQFTRGSTEVQHMVFEAFVRQRQRINNWNLVDSSAPYIAGPYLLHRDRAVLDVWVQSPVLWERRIAVLSTFAFIRAGDPSDTMRLCALLLSDPQDLIHKACGWMLRDIGKRDMQALEMFLNQHAAAMPRTMLRYAIEKMPQYQRLDYLSAGKRTPA